LDYTKVTNLDPGSIELERVIQADIDREMHAQILYGIAPGLSMVPEALMRMEETCRRMLLPWEQVDKEAEPDYDQMYYDNIGRFEDEQEKDV